MVLPAKWLMRPWTGEQWDSSTSRLNKNNFKCNAILHASRVLKVDHYRDPSEFEIHLSALMIKCLLLAIAELLPRNHSKFVLHVKQKAVSDVWNECTMFSKSITSAIKFSSLQHLSRKVQVKSNSPNSYSANTTSQQHTVDVCHKKSKNVKFFHSRDSWEPNRKEQKLKLFQGQHTSLKW